MRGRTRMTRLRHTQRNTERNKVPIVAELQASAARGSLQSICDKGHYHIFRLIKNAGEYVVRLSAEERAQLDGLIRKGKRSAQLLTRARILLKADVSEVGEGWSDSRTALDTSIATIERTRRQLVEEGFEAALTRKYNPNSARPRIFDGAAEAKLIALTLSPAPEGFARWSLRLLEEKVVELHIVERASDNTIGRTLKKTFSNRIASSNG